MRVAVAVGLLALAPARAFAEADVAPPPPPAWSTLGPRNAVTTAPLAFLARGAALSYERLVTPRVSVVALGGYRSAALGDYASTTWTGGVEARVWVRWPRTAVAMSGPYLGLHVSVGYTQLTDRTTATRVGSSWGLSERLDFGWRFVALGHLAVAPWVGLGLREDVDGRGRLATTARVAGAFGFDVGWMF